MGAVTEAPHDSRTRPQAACPLRPGEPCTLCHADAYLGPQDCPIVALVMGDDVLRAEMHRRRVEFASRTHPKADT
jgi:hypothetical protein